jgi:hypothetical protein
MLAKQTADSFSVPKPKQAVVLGLILCLALGLRLFHLGTQELRGDEAFDVLFSAQAVKVILDQLRIEQPYPPLFHVGYTTARAGGPERGNAAIACLCEQRAAFALVYQLAHNLGATTGDAAALVNQSFYVCTPRRPGAACWRHSRQRPLAKSTSPGPGDLATAWPIEPVAAAL